LNRLNDLNSLNPNPDYSRSNSAKTKVICRKGIVAILAKAPRKSAGTR